MDVYVDGKLFPWKKTTISGVEIHSLVGKDADYQAFRESPGTEPDSLITLSDRVKLKHGNRFYLVSKAYYAASEKGGVE